MYLVYEQRYSRHIEMVFQMKTNIKIFSWFILHGIVYIALYLGCTITPDDDNVAGTGSQAGNGMVVSAVMDKDGNPVPDAEVFIRHKNYLHDTINISEKEAPDTYTNPNGMFIISSIKPGDYIISIITDNDEAIVFPFEKKGDDFVNDTLDTISLTPTASFHGSINRENIPAGINIFVQIYGMKYIEKVDAKGRFEFSNIPAGTHRLRIVSGDTTLGIIENEVLKLDPSKNNDMGNLILPFEFWRDTLVVREFLDSNNEFETPVLDVVVIKDGRIVEINMIQRAIRYVPASIGLLRLKKLHLAENFIDSLPEEIGNISTLEYLNLMRNLLSRIPFGICNLKQLKHLDISGNNKYLKTNARNRLNFLPDEIGNLTKLRFLNVRKNNLISVPGSLGNLTDLQVLDLSKNKIATLPESFLKLNGFDYFSINYNDLASIHPDFRDWIDSNSTDKEWMITQGINILSPIKQNNLCPENNPEQ